jgi:hydroxymethylbilane synthase
VRLRILSRASDLARVQARLVGRALAAADPRVRIGYVTRHAAGDADQRTPLSQFADKGAFTADLSDALARGEADIVVHSWKDLPIEGRPDTVIEATLERADPRDVLLVRADVVREQPATLTVLSSSPRRIWLLDHVVPSLLPWAVRAVRAAPVRGNVPTRLRRLLDGRADALVVAKAALDRLLDAGPPFEGTAAAVRRALDRCRWMVLPIRDVPGAPAQGALAIEAALAARSVRARLAEITHTDTWRAVMREREVLAGHGGGCHAPLGATVLVRDYGEILSVRAQHASHDEAVWTLTSTRPRPPRAPLEHIWPTPVDRAAVVRRPVPATPCRADAFWVAREEALPPTWRLVDRTIVWAAGARTWRKLAARGVWVHGCADGLGEGEAPAVDLLAGRPLAWRRLTHRAAAALDGIATYEVARELPRDLPRRSHFFWTSSTELREALSRWPELRDRWHACGPGRTAQAMAELLGRHERSGVWLDYDQWLAEVHRA